MGIFDFFKSKPKDSKDTPENKAQQVKPKAKEFYSLQVAKVVKETDDAISVYLQIPPLLEEIFTFLPGQYITLRQKVAGVTYLRSYSISAYKSKNDGLLRIGIKRKPGGALSGYLVDTLAKGDSLEVFPPLGNFTPDLGAPTTTYFLYAGGSGITPMIAIAQYLLALLPQCKVVLYYANRTAKGIIYFDELTNLKEDYGSRFDVWHIIDEELNEYVKNALGFEPLKGIFYADDYARELTARYADSLPDEGAHFICGPTPMMQEVEHALYELGVNAGDIKVEYFDIEKQPSLPANPEILPPPTTLPKPKDGETLAQIHLQGATHWVRIAKGDTVLNACLNAGLDAPFMCESGVCATCRATLVKGKVDLMANYSLNAADLEKGYILTCQALPTTNEVEITY